MCNRVQISTVCLLFLGCLISFTAYAQNVGINPTGTNPDPSAMLDVVSTDKGMLIPRMSSAQRAGIGSPATGLLVFDTDANGFMFYNGTQWRSVGSDDLGTHTATQNIQTGGNWLSGDGGNEGVFVDAAGRVGVAKSNPLARFEVAASGSAIWSDDLTTTAHTITASSGHPSQPPTNLITNSSTPWFASSGTNTGWILYDFGAGNAQQIERYTIAAGFYWPTAWNFQGSNDGTTFTTLHSVSGASASTWPTPNIYTLSNNTAYRYYRLELTAGSNPNNVGFEELEMMVQTAPAAFKVADDGSVTINESYTLPTADGAAGQVLQSDGNGAASWAAPTANTDNQDLTLSGNTLAISNDPNTNVDLTPYLDNTDDQTVDKFNLNNTTLELSLEADGATDYTVDLAGLRDNLGDHTATENLQTAGNWVSSDGGNEGVFVATTGNVGIGHNSPTNRLHVANNTLSYTGDLTSTAHSISASTQIGGYEPYRAFDNTNWRWSTSTGNPTGWLMYDFGAGNEQAIARYTIASWVDWPTAWNFQGSNDGSSFTTLHTVSGSGQLNFGSPAVHSFANTTPYRYYRVEVTASSSASRVLK